MSEHFNMLLAGAIVMGCWAIGLFFLRFWRRTRDRLFLWFAVAFWMLSVERLLAPLFGLPQEHAMWAYVTRLAAFLTIVVAIIDKNRAGGAREATPADEHRP